jgi:hypothetical protein
MDPGKIQLTGDTVDLGQGNLCAQCHQPRWSYQVPQGDADVKIESIRFGPHHGVQSTVIAGIGNAGNKFTGSSVHYKGVKDSCVTCHMADAYGGQAGGHTFNMEYEYHGHEVPNLAGCKSCHEDIEDFDKGGLQTEVAAMMEELKGLLIAKGIMNAETGLAVQGTYSAELATAFWNYKTLEEDGSHGVHNPQYAKSLLKSGIDSIK